MKLGTTLRTIESSQGCWNETLTGSFLRGTAGKRPINRRWARSIDTRSASLRWGTYGYPGYLLKTHNRRCARSSDTRSASLRWGTYGWSKECVNVHHRDLPMAGLFCQCALSYQSLFCSTEIDSLLLFSRSKCLTPNWHFLKMG